MHEQQMMVLKMKAEGFDRILEKYQELQNSNFYSRNWVELSEVIEVARKWIAEAEKD